MFPVGEHEWQVYLCCSWNQMSVTATLLPTATDNDAYTERLRAEKEAAEAAARSAAAEQLGGVAGVAIEGLPEAKLNSVYLSAGEHEGWPRCVSAAGTHLYYYRPYQMWFVSPQFAPSSDTRAASVAGTGGRLPVGAKETSPVGSAPE